MSFGIPLRSGVFVGAAAVATLTTLSRTSVNDFRVAMPAGSTYTRTGDATGLNLAGVLLLFAADAPQRTDRGLAIEPERTNLLLNSLLAGGGTTPTSWTLGGSTGTATPQTSTVYPAGVAYVMAGTAQRSYHQQDSVTLPIGDHILSCQMEAASGGLTATQVLAMFGATAVANPRAYPVSPANPAGGSAGVVGTGRLDCTLTVTTGGTCSVRGGMGVGANATGSVTYCLPQVEASATFASSYIPTGGAPATRGLPVFTEPVPAARTKVRLTFADASTLLVSGLTPGGTFDYVAPILAAGKGRYGSSELTTRVWQP